MQLLLVQILNDVISGKIIGEPKYVPPSWKLIYGFLIGPGANLTGTNLSVLNLTDATLSGANLSYATLSGANLSYANLTDANLTGATLSYANLT